MIDESGASKRNGPVTGASGFIGGAALSALSEKYNVIGLDRRIPEDESSAVRFIEIDLTSDKSIDKALAEIRGFSGSPIRSMN